MGLPFVALADDLSGAAEIAPLLSCAASDGTIDGVMITTDASELGPHHSIIDLDVRDRPVNEVAPHVAAALEALRSVGARPAAVKIDSLIRGPIGSVIVATRNAGLSVVLAPALPELGRTTIHGRLRIDGHPPERFAELTLDPLLADGDIAAALAPLPVEGVPLDVVLRGPEPLADALRSALGRAVVPLVDATSPQHLDTVVATVKRIDAVVVGSGGVIGALGRSAAETTLDAVMHRIAPRPVLVVVGTTSRIAHEQVDALVASGLHRIGLTIDEVLTNDFTRHAHVERDTVLTIAADEPLRPELADRLAAGLGMIGARLGARSHLVLTGGATARRVLDAAAIPRLHPIRVVEHGCVLSLSDDGRAVVTRPGSFGTSTTLLAAIRAIRAIQTEESSSTPRKAATQ